ncbi:MAG: hypothetical protein A3C58_02205 [Candidatus Staskawiczbacteria bacterium RIFCSPHIGHO2_02_FULL_34_10]|uniref:Uncharacterized protein n=1 Tax=Candidatus Staskawiczbacteria bacterium RIFCSPHIGHO2_02_FULL_34_10 TaxID=1802205 RepID=A0A1G2HYC0_9BACT|nr:MAG: hypothetical protein A3C58_02205 [Candidatus Staskawiczbacteria bacterium RIFCSPHIGHO2_02_FULL_34_10]
MLLKKTDHLLKLKIVLKSTTQFTDEYAWKIFIDTEIESQDDIEVVMNYVATYRPKIYRQLQKLSQSLQ